MTTSINQPSHSEDEIKQAVRETYARAISRGGGCCSSASSCCPTDANQDPVKMAHYSPQDLAELPSDAVENSFGCGNPLAFAGVQPGDVVLDIGSGAGIDVLLASKIVGPTGRVIGLDFTPQMIARAWENSIRAGVENVEFRLGDAEQMPLHDSSVDWVISNCVINLAPNKHKVFAEVFRVLKPGGSVSISDIVTGELPDDIRNDLALWASCVSGAIEESEYMRIMGEAGLTDVRVVARQHYDESSVRGFIKDGVPDGPDREQVEGILERGKDVLSQVWSAKIVGRKPE